MGTSGPLLQWNRVLGMRGMRGMVRRECGCGGVSVRGGERSGTAHRVARRSTSRVAPRRSSRRVSPRVARRVARRRSPPVASLVIHRRGLVCYVAIHVAESGWEGTNTNTSKHRTSNIEHRTSNIEHRTSNTASPQHPGVLVG